MKRLSWFLGVMLGLLFWGAMHPGLAGTVQEYPQSIEEEIKSLLAAGADESSDPVFLTRLADLYLDAGNILYSKKNKRLWAYEEGAQYAKRALDLQETNAQAHYLYAANLGSAAELKGVMASAFTVMKIKKHTRRALELDPDHAAALHTMGMLLQELPALLGGDSEEALVYLQRSVEVDPPYTGARLNLAKAYIARKDNTQAKKELRTILQTEHPRNPYTWAHRHKPEAETLLQSLAATKP